jgi:hypothetical protein
MGDISPKMKHVVSVIRIMITTSVKYELTKTKSVPSFSISSNSSIWVMEHPLGRRSWNRNDQRDDRIIHFGRIASSTDTITTSSYGGICTVLVGAINAVGPMMKYTIYIYK